MILKNFRPCGWMFYEDPPLGIVAYKGGWCLVMMVHIPVLTIEGNR